MLAEALGSAGRVAEGLAAVDKAITRSERTEERWAIAEVLRAKGELLLLHDESTAAEEHFMQGLDWARRQELLSWEMRSATSLVRLWHQRGRNSQARELLAPAYRRFTEGFGTADLKAEETSRRATIVCDPLMNLLCQHAGPEWGGRGIAPPASISAASTLKARPLTVPVVS